MKKFKAKLQKSGDNKGAWHARAKAIGKDVGDSVTVQVEERLN